MGTTEMPVLRTAADSFALPAHNSRKMQGFVPSMLAGNTSWKNEELSSSCKNFWNGLVPSTVIHGFFGRGWANLITCHRESLFPVVQGRVRLITAFDAATMQTTLTLLFVD